MNGISGIDGLFRPFGAPTLSRLDTHGLRRGLHSFRRFAARPISPKLGGTQVYRAFDQAPLTCYKSWFCIGPPASNRRPLRYETSDAAKLNTPVQSRVVEACSELRQCAPWRSLAERPVGAVRWVAVPKHVMVLK